jgi:hypothetical protein
MCLRLEWCKLSVVFVEYACILNVPKKYIQVLEKSMARDIGCHIHNHEGEITKNNFAMFLVG